MTDSNGETLRRKGDSRKGGIVLRVITNEEGLPKPHLTSDGWKSRPIRERSPNHPWSDHSD
ncbi:hypothetical protein M433DRAFT_8959 [Acidomyces richmondensis BFW]|nr:MAG: hypothetical protein FE78DRAFT_32639 [Acidomyces sp. 'richmondensis']KYG40315.1 hypothetical protein M433DRAFT_8959 [Acidomyces richmondensis BFW]